MSSILPDFYQIARVPSDSQRLVDLAAPGAATIFADLLKHSVYATQVRPQIAPGLLLDLLHADLPVLGAQLAADYLRQLTAFRHQYPDYRILEDADFIGSQAHVNHIKRMFFVSRYMDADYLAMDSLANFHNPGKHRKPESNQRMYAFFVHKMLNYVPFFVVRPLFVFANLQKVLDGNDNMHKYALRSLTPYYLMRDRVDTTVHMPDRWVDVYLANNAPERWRTMLRTPLVLP